jgi:hypothetical protein
MTHSRRSSVTTVARYGPVLVVALAFLHAVMVGWLKWGNVLVDGGRELELPRRLLAGEHLYRDVRYYYGPFAPILNEWLYWVFGVNVRTLVAAGLVSAVLAVAAIYRIATLLVGWPFAALTSVAFIYVCAFGHLTVNPSFNFALPYTYSATYGMVAALWSLFFALRFLEAGPAGKSRNTAAAFWSTLLAAVACLCKLETALPVVAIHGVVLVTTALDDRERLGAYLLSLAAAVVIVASVFGWFAYDAGPGLWTDNLGALFNEGSRVYVRSTLGTDHPGPRLLVIAVSVLILGLTLVLAYVTEQQVRKAPTRVIARTLLATCALVTAVLYSRVPLQFQLAALPVVATAAIVLLLKAYANRSDEERPTVMHLTLWVFILAALSRIVLRVWAGHYGFYLVPAGLVGLSIVYFDYGRRWCRRRGYEGTAFCWAGSAMLVALAVSHWSVSARAYAGHVYELSTARGHMYLNSDFEVRAVAALSNVDRAARLLVIPQGAGLAFFSGLRDADRMSSYLPMELSGSQADADLLRSWQAHPPDLVVWYPQDLSEFGYRAFGVDYAQRSAAWLRSHYALVDRSIWLYVRR